MLGALAVRSPARAVVELNITQGTIQPLPIAIPDFAGDGSVEPQIGARDLRRGGERSARLGLVRLPSTRRPSSRRASAPTRVPRFDDWRVVNAQALVVGRIGSGDGRLKAEFRLWDVFAGKQLAGEQFFARPQGLRAASAIIIADAIYERITGEKGYFDTRIVFVDESGPEGQAHQAPGHHGSGRLQRAGC